MDRNEVFASVSDIINNTLFEKRTIQMQHNLVDDLGMDSIGFVELVTGLEEKFGVEIDDEEIEEYKTIGQVVEFVMSRP
jgi:acyl carrier protein